LGEFLCSRRDRWLLATKYSGQKGGMIAWAEKQLRVLRTDRIDFYQIHWVPREDGEPGMYDELYRLKKSGKARFVGVSLYTAEDIDYVLDHQHIDGFQIKFSLLDPQPFLQRLGRIRDAGLGIIIRSCFKEGFLTGKFTADSTFPDPADQRHKWGHGQIQKTVEDSERFRFLEKSEGSMSLGAARYPLSFAETSTLILGTKSVSQAEFNFGKVPGGVLADETRRRIATVQKSLVQ
jgi:aryl-alcohol dehydrogenase-like predicted oxidoreductase